MANTTKNDFIGETTREYNKCHQCKCYFTGNKGRIYCAVCAPVDIKEDQINVDLNSK